MAELERQKEEREKVPVPVQKHEQKLEREQPVQAQEPGEQSEVPRRWYVYQDGTKFGKTKKAALSRIMTKGGLLEMKKYPCIMVVDDEQAILRLLNRTLEPEGYGVIVADNGRVALDLLEERMPDVVLLDIMMPDLNGFQVLDLIRQRSSVPVIMLTAKGEVSTLRDALALGADDYVRKPFHTQELLARIRAKLRRVGQRGNYA